ncbi:FAD-dependent oxidoreductase [Streptomonospora sp. S1-112]|uniref:FAD-dependent oxidoreductase n=1 Tax=Streptomonospora mangrovi TaxID=2883123 RepID=A0A9X3NSL6_9ACTN|nr:FAD-dependent oxidoreductase [Streptomonospora mangrovi]MDA0563376.1 FAD-dependent oxidoreductase [Streptomonospora mangrovi]
MNINAEAGPRPAGDVDGAEYDVVVVGGGAAGLAGAVALARARRSVLVVDAGQPRNAPAEGIHVYLGSEGRPPARFLAKGRAEVAAYGGEVVAGRVEEVRRRPEGGFTVAVAGGAAVGARRLLVATGLVDELPPIAGLAERWGRDVLHCPYCHGYEVRDQAIGVVATGPLSVHQALLWRQWSADVVLFTNGALQVGAADAERLAARGITVVEGEIAAVEVHDDHLSGVRLADGRVVARQALAVGAQGRARADVPAGLDLPVTEVAREGHVMGTQVSADPMGATGVPGVWVAGNVANVVEQVIGSAAAGVRAGAAINADLVEEDTEAALAAYRADPLSARGEAAAAARVAGDARHGL